jgi:hypothetical protein
MPFFKSTYNILKKYDEDEAFESKWMDSDKLVLPPKVDWDYNREMIIEDVDLWEVLYEASGGIGVYAAWLPYAEFYMITTGLDFRNKVRYINEIPYYDRQIETFYGPGAQEKLVKRTGELGINLSIHQTWVDLEDMWLYSQDPQPPKPIIILP